MPRHLCLHVLHTSIPAPPHHTAPREVIDTAEYRRRLAAAKEAGVRDFYMMALGPGRIIDAARKGNLVRFINSSCEPNCEAQKWTDAATGVKRGCDGGC